MYCHPIRDRRGERVKDCVYIHNLLISMRLRVRQRMK